MRNKTRLYLAEAVHKIISNISHPNVLLTQKAVYVVVVLQMIG